MEVAALIASNMQWMRRQAAWFCHNTDEADEIMSETILRCLESASSFESGRAFRPWAKAIMNHISIDYFRKNRYIPFEERYIAEDKDCCNNTESEIHYNEICRILNLMAGRSRCVRCLMLYLDGYTYKEIAEREQISIGTVKSRLNSARTNLRNYF